MVIVHWQQVCFNTETLLPSLLQKGRATTCIGWLKKWKSFTEKDKLLFQNKPPRLFLKWLNVERFCWGPWAQTEAWVLYRSRSWSPGIPTGRSRRSYRCRLCKVLHLHRALTRMRRHLQDRQSCFCHIDDMTLLASSKYLKYAWTLTWSDENQQPTRVHFC